MKKLFIIGDPVDHSLSPIIHNIALKKLGLEEKFSYEKMLVQKKDLKEIINKIRNDEICGISVTMPHKELIIQYLDQLTVEAELIQAVNTVYKENGRIIGHNTDGIGCIRALEEIEASPIGKNVVLLGAGGAAKAIAYKLVLYKIKKLYIINRTKKRAEDLSKCIFEKTNFQTNYGNFDDLKNAVEDADIIINATSIGMKGAVVNKSIISASQLMSNIVVQDIVYNPIKTKFLREAEKAGAKIVNGLSMLLFQGAEQFQIFTGRNAPIDNMRKGLLEVINENNSK